MARVTVEDCTPVVENRFDLVLLAAERARAIARGSELSVPRDEDKNPVVALREIADEKLDLGNLREGIVRSLQKHFERDEVEDEDPVEAYAKSLGLESVPPPPEEELVSEEGDVGMRVVDGAAGLDAEGVEAAPEAPGDASEDAPEEAGAESAAGDSADPIEAEAGEADGEESFG